jgi:hypothetical protein
MIIYAMKQSTLPEAIVDRFAHNDGWAALARFRKLA